MTGVINLDKPAGLSSARAVSRVKRLLPKGVRIGHAGTLDPFATGVLLLMVGSATKLAERFMDQPKQYEATVRLGATTATDDLDSPPQAWPSSSAPPSIEAVREVLIRFVGHVSQRPPAFSALKVGGRRAYALARKGEELVLKERQVKIYAVELIGYEWPDIRLRVDCGRGTYIRALARDLGEALDQGGYLTALRRTKIGPYVAAEGVSLERLTAEGVKQHLLEPALASQ